MVDVELDDGITKWFKPFGCRRLLGIFSLSTLFAVAMLEGLYIKRRKQICE